MEEQKPEAKIGFEGQGPEPEYMDCWPVAVHQKIGLGEFCRVLVEGNTFDRRLAGPGPVGSNAFSETVALLRELERNLPFLQEVLRFGPVTAQWWAWVKSPRGFRRERWHYRVTGTAFQGTLGLEIVEVEGGVPDAREAEAAT